MSEDLDLCKKAIRIIEVMHTKRGNIYYYFRLKNGYWKTYRSSIEAIKMCVIYLREGKIECVQDSES